jgi:mono/diheme cytochrome c family protein
VFSQNKAKLLLTEKLSCLGCHRLGDRGGKIGPELTSAGLRLQPDYLFGIIKNPQAVVPHSVMPKVSIPDPTAQLIANFLLAQTGPPTATSYLSAVDYPLIPLDARPTHDPAGPESAGRVYLRHCAACHGTGGRGDGFNARFLPVKPTNHSDPVYLSTRPDDTLFDGIHAGGYILNRSQLMPAWGETFTPREIRELVGFIRTLCACQPPAWSRDNSSRP